jgi:predicted nucleotidyltransferase component of viral defense system
MADPELLRYLSARTGLGVKYLSRDEKISVALEQLRDRFPQAVLKGGTALNRVFLAKSGASRFSEDIDLDFISGDPLPQKIDRIKEQIRGLEGFDPGSPRLLHRTLRFDCRYTNEYGDRDRVMVEFYLTQMPFLRIDQVLVKSPFIETHPSLFPVYSLEDLLARKLIALYSRSEGKDVYDVTYCLGLEFDHAAFEKALAMTCSFYRIKRETFPEMLQEKLAAMRKNATYIGNSTNHFIPVGRRPDWKIFIDSLAIQVRTLLSPDNE